MFSVQYHPEASPGPRDSHYLFTRFVEMMRKRKRASGLQPQRCATRLVIFDFDGTLADSFPWFAASSTTSPTATASSASSRTRSTRCAAWTPAN